MIAQLEGLKKKIAESTGGRSALKGLIHAAMERLRLAPEADAGSDADDLRRYQSLRSLYRRQYITCEHLQG